MASGSDTTSNGSRQGADAAASTPARNGAARRSSRPALSPSSLPYYVAAFAAATAMAWYFFLFVPSKLEYFVGVRMRALAVAANQIRSKAVNLASALESAAGCKTDQQATALQTFAVQEYLRRLVPEIQYEEPTVPAPGQQQPTAISRRKAAGLQLAARRCDDATVRGTVAWEDLVMHAVPPARADFEDLVLALPDGDVVWQREETTPRIGNLAQVLYGEEPSSGWFSFAWNARNELPNVKAAQLPRAGATRRVSIGGKDMLLLVQPVTLVAEDFGPLGASAPRAPADASARSEATGRTLFVAGLVSRSRLQAEAMDIPLAWVVLLALPMVLLFLALPFVKLATLTRRERFGFVDAVALVLAALLLASLAAVMPFVITPVDEETDHGLERFSAELASSLIADVRSVLTFGTYVNRHKDTLAPLMEPCVSFVARPAAVGTGDQPAAQATRQASAPSERRCDLWAALRKSEDPKLPALAIDLDVVIWLDEQGEQVDKWTTKELPTHRVSHARLQHFRDLQIDRLWRLTDDPEPRFTIDPLRAPTTAALGVIVAFPITKRSDGSQYLAVNLRLPAVQDVVVPPEYGFAVLGARGEVLFHSDESKSLQENFFEELGEPDLARRHARAGHLRAWSGDYHGRPHRLHVRRMDAIEGLPWRVVTFRDLTPSLARVTAHHSRTFRLVLINVALLVLLAAGALAYSKARRRDAGDLLNVSRVVSPRRLQGLLALVVLGAAGLYLTHAAWMRPYLTAVHVLFAALPLLAIATSVHARRGGSSSALPRSTMTTVLRRSELALLVLLVAALPAAGFARLVDRIHGINQATAWLEEMQRRIADRNAQVLSRVKAPAYANLGATRIALVRSGFADPRRVQQYVYMDFLPGAPSTATPRGRAYDDDGAAGGGPRLLRFLLDWNPLPSRDVTGYPPLIAVGSKLHLDPIVSGPPALQVNEPAHAVPITLVATTSYSLPPGKLLLGLALLAATIAAAYWARLKVRVRTPPLMPAIDDVIGNLPRSGSHGVMLIGPPQTRKDAAVYRALERVEAKVTRRIRLLGVTADAALTNAERSRLASMPSTDAPACQWVHVSNIETHLGDAARRRLAVNLLDGLLDSEGHRRVVIVTTTVDPIAHFEEIFDEERRGIYDNPMPENELSRVALLLTRFRRCYLPMCPVDVGVDPWWDYDPAQWRTVLAWETRLAPLAQVEREVLAAFDKHDAVALGALADAVSARAHAFYQLLWTSCTRHEKLVLAQLAQEGFVTSNTDDAIAALLAKGLIVKRSGPAIFNRTFRAFLRRIERGDVLREWERGEGQGLWVVAGRLIASSVVVGGLFFLLTQGYSVQALLPVISGSGVFSVPLVRSLMARLSGGSPQGSGSTA